MVNSGDHIGTKERLSLGQPGKCGKASGGKASQKRLRGSRNSGELGIKCFIFSSICLAPSIMISLNPNNNLAGLKAQRNSVICPKSH